MASSGRNVPSSQFLIFVAGSGRHFRPDWSRRQWYIWPSVQGTSALNVHSFQSGKEFYKCNFIWENLTYGGTNIVSSGQTPFVTTRSVWSRPTIFFTHEHLQRKILSLPVLFQQKILSKTYKNSWSRRTLFVRKTSTAKTCLIKQVFTVDVTLMIEFMIQHTFAFR